MGCVCAKAYAEDDDIAGEKLKLQEPPVKSTAPAPAPVVPSRREEVAGGQSREMKVRSGPIRTGGQEGERKKEVHAASVAAVAPAAACLGVPKGLDGELVAAGWPAWLAAVAGESIRGWVPRRADSFEKLDKIGQGTYSSVYRARDLDNGGKIVALKKVRFDNMEPESVRFMAREIHILRRLDHPNIVKLEGLVTSRMSCSLYLVFEYMEHDLAGLASSPGLKFTEPQAKCYMQQLLRGLDHCHSHGVLHRDIKGSNLLIDNSGILKIADFGLANFFDSEQRHPLTSRVVTLWYRPPELLLGANYYGVAVDLWSTGCILAELYAGKPIMPGRTEVEQLHKIFKLCGSPTDDYWRKSKLPHATIFKPQQPYARCVAETFKDFPQSALSLMEVLLSFDPADRGTATSALESEYFTAKPLACDPSSLPKYPPSKEFDAKVRDEESRRRGATGNKFQRLDLERKGAKESRAVPAPDANAELPSSLQKRQSHPNSRSRSEKFNHHQEEVASGFPIEPPRVLEAPKVSKSHYCSRASHSGPLAHQGQWANGGRNDDDMPKVPSIANLSALSGLVAARRNALAVDGNERFGTQFEPVIPAGRFSESGIEPLDSVRRYDQVRNAHELAGSRRKDEEKAHNTEKSRGYASKGNKLHYSGPLLLASGNVDQVLEDHDRQIQEVFRRSRADKPKIKRVQASCSLASTGKPSDIGVFPVYPSSRGSPLVFTSSRGAMQ